MLVSVAIPTYQRGTVLLETIESLQSLVPTSLEVIVVDQTAKHEAKIEQALTELYEKHIIRWYRLDKPSITHAMNVALQQARGEIVLFVDDDIIPRSDLVAAHKTAHAKSDLVAGQVLQPGEVLSPLQPDEKLFRFNTTESRYISEFIGCNFSVKREKALAIGGFDENFLGAAFNYEAEFASRFIKHFGPILFEPKASLRHLRIQRGGTRAHGHHLRTAKPTHSVGAYYYFLKVRPHHWWQQALWRPFRSVRTRHHLSHPWWIIPSLLAEVSGFFWALKLLAAGPKYLESSETSPSEVLPSCEL